MLKDQLQDWVSKVELRKAANINLSFDFLIHHGEARQEYHIRTFDGELELNEGRSERPIGLLEASEESLQALINLGINPFDRLLKLDMPKEAGSFRLPDLDEAISIESATPDGNPLHFYLYLENNCLNIIETNEQEGDMHVWIRDDYLPRILNGDVNVAVALFTGKIKIRNKRKLFTILTKFGLKL